MDAVLKQDVLVLNKAWVPINVTTVYDAICAVFSERAKFVDPETYMTYDFESWVDTWQDAMHVAKVSSHQVVSCPNVRIVVPEVITCTEYKGVGYGTNYRGRPKFSRRNIFTRDRNVCQYCGKHFEPQLLNIDHVLPKSKGGHSDWTNVVLSCIKCNDKKRDRTPEEAGMRLIRRPHIPTADQVRRPLHERLRRKLVGRVPKSWEGFLGKMISDMYWNVELRK
jgi:5-methylcytosine-specific restriction endonuclease McrA